MSELKTVKDIDEGKTYDKGNGVIGVEMLKQEAIKWYGKFQSKDWDDVEGHSDMGGEISGWIVHFFNLTNKEINYSSGGKSE